VTGYTVAHLIMAGVCAFVGLFYLLTWRLARTDAALAWVGVCFFGWILIDLALAGGSLAARGGLGDPRRWGVIAAPAVCFLPAAILRTAWSVMDVEVVRWRRAVLWGFTAVGLAKAIEFVLAIRAAGAAFALESVAGAVDTPIAVLFWAVCFAVCALSLVDGLAMVRRKPGLALSVILVALPVCALFAREVAIGAGWTSGPTLFGVAGLWFMLFAAVVTGVRHARGIPRAAEGGDLSRYQVLGKLGGGGMGETFLATRKGPAGFSRHVALKRIHHHTATDPAAIERFLGEARIAATLRHPNVVAVYDLGAADDGWFLVMEYVAGVTMAQVIQRAADADQRVPLPVVAAVGVQVCRGLAAAHARGVVHRDISPDNLMVSFAGDVKIVDFGIAEAGAAFAAGEGWTGKIPYAAPERIAGGLATAQSDLFSLGVVLYELLAGRRPFEGQDDQDTAQRILHDAYEPVGRLREDVPAALEQAIDRALARRQSGRPESARALEQQLVPHLDPAAGDLAEWTRSWFPERWQAERELEVGAAVRAGATAGDDEVTRTLVAKP
jgi:eukaryotic-like serine/threonine-protein kinase